MSVDRGRDCDRPLRSRQARECGYGSKCVRRHRPAQAPAANRRGRGAPTGRRGAPIPGQQELDLTEPENTDA